MPMQKQFFNNQNLEIFEKLVTEFQTENPAIESSKIASALAFIAQGSEPLLISDKAQSFGREQTQGEVKTLSTKATPLKDHPQIPMCRYLAWSVPASCDFIVLFSEFCHI
jgi:ATP-dependent RNA helicase DeaD